MPSIAEPAQDVTMLSASFFVYCLYHQLQNLFSTLSCSLPLSLSNCLPHRLQSLLQTVCITDSRACSVHYRAPYLCLCLTACPIVCKACSRLSYLVYGLYHLYVQYIIMLSDSVFVYSLDCRACLIHYRALCLCLRLLSISLIAELA